MNKSQKFLAAIVLVLVVVFLFRTDLKRKNIGGPHKTPLLNALDKSKAIVSDTKPQVIKSNDKKDVVNNLDETDPKKMESEKLTLQSLRELQSELTKSSKTLCLSGLAAIQKKSEEASVEEKTNAVWMDRTEAMASVEVLNATSDFVLNFPASRDVMNYQMLANNPEEQKRLLGGRSLDSLKNQSFNELKAHTPLRQALEDRTYYNWMLMKILTRNPSLAASTEAQDLCSRFSDFSKQLSRTDLDSILQNFLMRAQVTAQDIQYDPKFNTKIELSVSKNGYPAFNVPTWVEWQMQTRAKKK